jgi:hypothetical protein
MAKQTQKVTHASGGITPLGVFTITPGTPQSILANCNLPTVRYALQCRQIGISVDSGSGVAFLNYGNYNGGGGGVPDPLATVLMVGAGQQSSFPIGARTTDGMIDATQYYLDGSAAVVVAVYLSDATSS